MNYILIAGFIFLAIAAFQFFKHYEKAKGDVTQRMGNVQAKEGNDIGLTAAWYGTKQAKAATEMNVELTAQASSVYDLDAVIDRKQRQEQTEIAVQGNHLKSISLADRHEMPMGGYESLKLQEGLSQIETSRQRELRQIETDAALMEQLNTIRAILEYKHLRFDEIEEFRNRVMDLIDEEERIENSNASALVKGQKLELIEADKQFYKEKLNAYKNRLLETGNEEDILGSEAFDSFGGRPGMDTKASS